MADVVWSVPKRVAFRFGFVMGALYVFPFPIGTLPKTEWLAELLNKPIEWLVLWFGESVLGSDPVVQPTGSGDTAFQWTWMVMLVLLGALGAGVWSALDRKRTAYPRLAAGSVIVLRYVLASALLSYGFAKIVNTQFPPPDAMRLDSRLGDTSPMGLLWTFMGYSEPYTVFGGLCEVVGGFLLLHRRTTTLGALAVMAVMTNVVMLNFCYDVPVKLYSLQLLAIAGIIAMPQLRRIFAALLGFAVAAVPERPRMSLGRERARLAVKSVFVLALAYSLYAQGAEAREFMSRTTELDGRWAVQTWSADGTQRPPLATDKERWRFVGFTSYGARIRLMTDDSVRTGLEIDQTAHTITLRGDPPTTWRYSLAGDQLVIDGKFKDKQLHVTLVKQPEWLLTSRPFHWVQEFPFNR